MKRIWKLIALLILGTSWSATAAVTHVASTSAGGYSTRLRLTVPTSAAAGDVLLVKVGVRRRTSSGSVFYTCASMPAVAGWTKLRCDEDGTLHAQAIYWKYAVAGDAGRRYTWTFGSASAYYAGGMSVYRGADQTNPIDGNAGLVTTLTTTVPSGSTLTDVAPSITTTVSGDMIVALFGANFSNATGGSVTPTAGMTERYERGSGGGNSGVLAEAADQLQATAGATGNRNASITLPGAYAQPYVLIGQQVAIKPPVAFDHINILQDGQGTTCAPETITLQACADSACATLYTGAVTVTLSPTDAASSWSANPVTFSGGSASLSYSHTATGTVTFGAPSIAPLPSASPSYRCYVGATQNCNMNFAAGGLAFTLPNLTACKPSPSVTMTATQSSGGSCGAAFSGTKTINFWSSYVSPATGTKNVSVNGTPIATSAPGTAISLTFDAAGTTSFTVTYPDAGSMRLNASYSSGSLTGSRGFIAVPVGIVAYGTAVDPTKCTAADTSCPVLAKAGDPFSMTVKAACWQSDTDPTLADNPATPNFQMTGIALASTVAGPVGGNNGTLGTASVDMLAANAGVVTIAGQTQDEVGVFTTTTTPTPGGYFGLTVPAATGPYVGRFIPHHFDIEPAPLLTNRSDISGCSASTFTYLGEAFQLDYTLRAEDVNGNLTTNYDSTLGGGAFARLDLTKQSSFGYGALSGTTNLTARLDLTQPTTGSWAGGLGTVSGTIALKRTTTPDGPWLATAIGIAPVDADSVAVDPTLFDLNVDGTGGNDHLNVGSTAFRYGRLRLNNAFGSELLDLPLAANPEYWNQYAFVSAADDTCTTLAPGNVALSFPASPRNNLSACKTSATVQAPPSLAVTLSKPGAGNSGWADAIVNLAATASGTACVGGAAVAATTANMPYLMYDWNSAVAGDENPSARATFGIFGSGGNAVIYQRESY